MKRNLQGVTPFSVKTFLTNLADVIERIAYKIQYCAPRKKGLPGGGKSTGAGSCRFRVEGKISQQPDRRVT
jgi:hypothetical protein